MRRLLTVLILLMPSLALAGTCGNGYSYGPIQIMLAKATGSNQTNFPFPIVGTFATLKTVANGGQVRNTANNSISVSGPADLVLCDASSAGNPLKYEVAMYSATTGAIEIWVQIPTLHSATNDSIYLFANNSGVVTSQQDLSMWSDASFVAVYHFPDGSSLGAKDSTAGHNGTINSATATTGQLDGSAAFVAGSSQYISSSLWTNATTNVTLEAWYNFNGSNQAAVILENGAAGSNGYELDVIDSTCGSNNRASVVVAGATCNAAGSVQLFSGWQYLAATRGASNWNLSRNAGGSGTSNTNGPTTPGTGSSIGRASNNSSYLTGSIDEARVATVAKSADWIATTYKTGGGAYPSYQIVGTTYSTPTIAQYVSCATTDMTSGTFSCVMPFPLTSGGVMVYSLGQTNFDCTNVPTDSLGLTLTLQTSADFTGSLQHYYNCLFTAPITSTGNDTITSGTGNYTAVIYEIKGVTTSGIALNQSSGVSPPASMSATCGASACFLLCSENLSNSTSFSYDTFGNSQGYTQVISPEAGPISNDHRAQTYTANAITTSGSKSCTITGTGQAGTLMLLPASASPAVRHRIVNQF